MSHGDVCQSILNNYAGDGLGWKVTGSWEYKKMWLALRINQAVPVSEPGENWSSEARKS